MSLRSFRPVVWAVALTVVSSLGIGDATPPSGSTSITSAAPLAAPDNSIVLQPFLSGLSSPVLVTHAGDSSGRLFIVELGGLIKVVRNGVVNPTPFLNLQSLVVSGGEQGLLGLAFHPNFESNGRFFVFYTAKPPPNQPPDPPPNVGSNTLAEYHASPASDVADPNPTRVLLSLYDRATNHNGGMLGFSSVDARNYLYVGTGDEGGGGDTFLNAQNLNSLYGKILRLDVDNVPSGQAYGIPSTNPFVGQSGVRPEIWLYGFRNPWRWSFDRQTGEMLIGDVGQGAWEEIDVIPSQPAAQAGRNYGWNIREGTHCYPPGTTSCSPNLTGKNALVNPVLEYDHNLGCSVTGGYRYRGADYPAIANLYFYADYCSGRIWKGSASGSSWSSVEALDSSNNISGWGEDQDGEVYVVALGGSIFRLAQAAPLATCPARPRVGVQSTRTGPGTLDVTLTANDAPSAPNNELLSVAFTRITNASVTINGQPGQQNAFTLAFQNGSRTARFTVRRTETGKAFQADFGVTDHCGVWRSFVGAGPGVS